MIYRYHAVEALMGVMGAAKDILLFIEIIKSIPGRR
jgi:hypothetical protein